jgi:hypothetical protein
MVTLVAERQRFDLYRDRAPGVLAWTVTASLIAHVAGATLPFVLPFLFRLLHRGADWDYEDNGVVIPVSLFEEPAEKPAEKTPEPAATQADAVPTAKPKPRPRPVIADAGAADVVDAAVADAEGPTDAAVTDAARAVASAQGEAGTQGADVLGLSGPVSQIVRGKPNVGLLVWFSSIREHPLGAAAGDIFACIPQWKEFIGDAIDPLRDIETLHMFGPRVVADTSKLTIIVQTQMKNERIQSVLRALGRKSSGGGWIDAGAGVLAARFRADRADRVALTHPKDLVIITPPEGYEQLRRIQEPVSLASPRGRAISLAMVTPWRPLNRGLGTRLPDTLTDMQLDVMPAADGGVDLEATFDDKDAASAEQHAPLLTSELSGVGSPFTSDLKFYANGNHMVGRLHLSRFATGVLLSGLRAQACPLADGGR